MRPKNVAAIFPELDEKRLTCIILAAGEGGRGRPFGNRSLVQVGGTPLILHQINTIRKKFASIADVIVCLGFDADRVFQTLPSNVRVVENEGYANTNNVRSLSLSLKAATTSSILMVYGDVYFEPTALPFKGQSALLIDSNGNFDKSKVGVTMHDKSVTRIAYGLSKKWAQIGLFAAKELSLLEKFCFDRTNDNLCVFEGINQIIDNGGNFLAVENKGVVREINTLKDVEAING